MTDGFNILGTQLSLSAERRGISLLALKTAQQFGIKEICLVFSMETTARVETIGILW